MSGLGGMIKETKIELKSSGSMRLAPYGKKMVALSMYAKGKGFLGAAGALSNMGGNESVVLYLLCQGIEVTLKGLLLFKDYDKYGGSIKKLSHNLEKIIDTVLSEYNRKALSKVHKKEIEVLNSLYSKHLLRYGTGYDIFLNPKTIPCDRTLRKFLAVTWVADRYIGDYVNPPKKPL